MKNLKVYKLPKRLAFFTLSMMFTLTGYSSCSHELAPEEDYNIVQTGGSVQF